MHVVLDAAIVVDCVCVVIDVSVVLGFAICVVCAKTKQYG